MMKKLIKAISLVLIIVFVSSCEKQFFYTYIIENETPYSIKIEGYDLILPGNQTNDSSGVYSETINIEPHSYFQISKQRGYDASSKGVFVRNNEIDSLSIKFDMEKQILFSCDAVICVSCVDKYNLLNHNDNYVKKKTGRSSGENEYSFTYTFTQADYDNAEFITKTDHR